MRTINRNLHTLAGSAIALALTSLGFAQDLRAPLSPQDPRAQLQIGTDEYKPLPTPKYASTTTQSAMVRLQSVDLETGAERQTSYLSANRPTFSFRAGQPFKGIATTPGQEPRSNFGGNSNDVNPLYVIGGDSRTKINTTASYPWSAQCKLFIRFPDGSNWIGSGTLVQSRFVVTAGHCVWDAGRGGWASQIQVVPGLNGTYQPFGSAYASRLASNSGWTSDKNRDHDHAVIKLDRTIGNSTGWLGYGSFSNTSINNSGLNLSAYDGDRDGGRSQLYRSGSASSLGSKQMEYEMDTSGGSSGGGVYIFYNGGRYCMGVNCWESWWWFFGTHYINGGTRLDNTKVGWMNNWLNGGL